MKPGPCSVRIIAGVLRGRRLHFPPVGQLRPTPDRVRETLFNWLNQVIAGARCLDCFAGSGALSFEAISRGAASALCIEADKKCVASLNDNVDKFNLAQSMKIYCTRFPRHLPKNFYDQTYDIVFVDPPFHQGIAQKTCDWLEQENCLSDVAWIYVECEKKLDLIAPQHWTPHRQTQCGEGKAILFKRTIHSDKQDVDMNVEDDFENDIDVNKK